MDFNLNQTRLTFFVGSMYTVQQPMMTLDILGCLSCLLCASLVRWN